MDMSQTKNAPMSPAQVAEYLQLNVKTIYRHLKAGTLHGMRLSDKCWRIAASDVYVFMQRGRR
jgi:excisionase family DNA binding protein